MKNRNMTEKTWSALSREPTVGWRAAVNAAVSPAKRNKKQQLHEDSQERRVESKHLIAVTGRAESGIQRSPALPVTPTDMTSLLITRSNFQEGCYNTENSTVCFALRDNNTDA